MKLSQPYVREMIQKQITFLQSLLDSDIEGGDGWEEVLCYGCSPAVGRGVNSLNNIIYDICIMSFISCGVMPCLPVILTED